MPSPSPPSPWGALLPAALAGTRRSPAPAPLPGLTPELGTEADAAEKQLLLSAASLRLVQRAGQRSAPGPATALPRHAPSPAVLAAEWLPLEPTSRQHLTELLVEKDNYCLSMAELGLPLLHEQRRRLPYQLLPRALAALIRCGGERLLATYAPVFGPRGAWLAALSDHEALRLAAARATQALHPRALLIERLGALTEFYHVDPAGAWQQVLAELPTAPADTQLKLLQWVQEGPVYDAPLPAALTAVLEELAARPASQPLFMLARYIGATLRELPDSTWAQRQWRRATTCLRLERPPHEPPRLRLQLPADVATDESWRQDEIPLDQGWLGRQLTAEEQESLIMLDLLERVAPSRWLAAWSLDLDEAVGLLPAAPEGYRLLSVMLRATAVWYDTAAARQLLAYVARHKDPGREVGGVAQTLPPAERAAWLRSVLPALPVRLTDVFLPTRAHMGPRAYWIEWVSSLGQSFGALAPEVTDVLLPFLRDILRQDEDYMWPVNELGQVLLFIALRGPLNLLPWYEAELPPLARARPPLAPTIERALRWLRWRQRLAGSAPQPPAPGHSPGL